VEDRNSGFRTGYISDVTSKTIKRYRQFLRGADGNVKCVHMPAQIMKLE
jgi:hypothetical protein